MSSQKKSSSDSFDYLTTSEDIAHFCAEVTHSCENGDFLTLDTEFIREKTYYPQLCLIQAATKDRAVIIDPLTESPDLSPLFSVLQNEDCPVVVHAGRQDMEIFYILMGCLPTAIFDTQVAAMVCGFGDSVSYETLVKSICKASLDKSSRFSNWAQRPLTKKQLEYAIKDVTHLRDIYQYLRHELDEKKRQTWIEEEMRVLLTPASYEVDFRKLLNKLRLRTTKAKPLLRADALLRWREAKAKADDKPRQQIMRDDLLAELALQAPKSKEDFRSIRGLQERQLKHATAIEILDIIKAASQKDDSEAPALPKPENHDRVPPLTYEALKLLLKYVAETEGVAEKIIASTRDLSDLARYEDDADIPCLKGWRFACFGKLALSFLSGETIISHADSHLQLKTSNSL